MTNKPKAIGTAGETGVVRAAKRLGFPHADRQPLRGNQDEGDATLVPGVIVSVKAGKAAKTASIALVEQWWDETVGMRERAKADVALLVVARNGYAPARAEYWRCFIEMDGLVVEAPFEKILLLLRRKGWGQPVEQLIEQHEAAA
jgi:hypothetical protein